MPKGQTSKEETWQCIEFWIKRNPDKTTEECQQLLNKKKEECRLKHPTNIQYWMNKCPDKSLEECQELLDYYKKSHNYNNIEYYKRLHPDWTEEMCQMARDNRLKEALSKRPDNSGKNNPAHKSKTTELQRKQRSVMCIEYYEKHYPELSHEDHLKLMDEKIKFVKYKHSLVPTWNSVSYWTDKGYTEEEAKMIIKNKGVSNGIKYYIKKYGEEEGKIRYDQRIRKWQNSLHNSFIRNGDSRSCQSRFAMNIIEELCQHLNIEIPEKEKYMTYGDHKFAYNFTYKDKIIEFNGDYWHCNPKLYSEDFVNKQYNMTAKEIWGKDSIKKECAIANGYKYLVVWELDYNQSPSETIENCIKFLDD